LALAVGVDVIGVVILADGLLKELGRQSQIAYWILLSVDLVSCPVRWRIGQVVVQLVLVLRDACVSAASGATLAASAATNAQAVDGLFSTLSLVLDRAVFLVLLLGLLGGEGDNEIQVEAQE